MLLWSEVRPHWGALIQLKYNDFGSRFFFKKPGILGKCRTGRTCWLTVEQKRNYVLFTFMEGTVLKAVIQEAAALTSLALFVGMIAIWSQVLGSL